MPPRRGRRTGRAMIERASRAQKPCSGSVGVARQDPPARDAAAAVEREQRRLERRRARAIETIGIRKPAMPIIRMNGSGIAIRSASPSATATPGEDDRAARGLHRAHDRLVLGSARARAPRGSGRRSAASSRPRSRARSAGRGSSRRSASRRGGRPSRRSRASPVIVHAAKMNGIVTAHESPKTSEQHEQRDRERDATRPSSGPALKIGSRSCWIGAGAGHVRVLDARPAARAARSTGRV